MVRKYVRYTGSKTAEIQLLLYYCEKIKSSDIPISKSLAVTKIFESQLEKIRNGLPDLHEDLRYDYSKQLEKLKI